MEWDPEARVLIATEDEQKLLLIGSTVPEREVHNLVVATQFSIIELAEKQRDLSCDYEVPDADSMTMVLATQREKQVAERLVKELKGFSWDIEARYIDA